MRNLIIKIYGLFRSNLWRAFLPVMLFAVCAFGQGTGDSVFIVNQTTTNNAAGVVADYLAGEIGEGIQDKFPCVDYSSPEDVKAVLDAARDRELLTGELSQEQLANIAGSIGARYVVLVTVTVLPNGQTIVNARLLDTKTTATLADEQETAASAEAAFNNAESVANKLLQKLSGIFKNRCEPHWTGTITYTKLIRSSAKTENPEGAGTRGRTVTVSETKRKNLSETVDIMLQPMTLGFSGKYSSQARVTQNYRYLEEYAESQAGEIPCREPGRNTYYKKVAGDTKITQTVDGSDTYVVTVFVRFSDDGSYVIQATGKTIKVTGKIEKSGNEAGCRPTPFSSTRETARDEGFYYIDLKGQVDPKNPDVLTGKKVEGDIETGQSTWTWSLRLVKPKTRK